MFEVYTGTKAGRPTVLLLLSTGALVGALGLAWTQVSGSRDLAEPVRIEGTPLIVRPPAGWIQHPSRPSVFVKTIESESWGRKREVAERTLEFRHKRWQIFQPPLDLLRLSNWLDHKEAFGLEAAPIAGFAGVQVRREQRFRWRGRVQIGESIYRLVSTARGDEISVEYTPLGGLSPGDLELFDAVCRAVVLDDPGVKLGPEEVLSRAGVQFAVSEDWQIIGPDFPQIPGLYVQNNEGGMPVWGLGVFRTWLAPGRRPTDLLASLAAHRWARFTQPVEPQRWTRSDGATIAVVRRPAYEPRGGQITSAWVLARSPAEVAVIFVLADSSVATAADQAAARLAEQLEFVTSYPADGIETAAANGRDLAELLRANGAAPWWGDDEVTSYYYGEISGQPLLVVSRREAIGGDHTRGYEGFDRYVNRDPSDDENHAWSIDGHAEAFTRRVETEFDRLGRAISLRLQEARDASESLVSRAVRTGDRFEELPVRVGAMFVAPPIETLAEGWVAQQDDGTWLIETSPLRGVAMATRLLMPLEPDADGRDRALLVEDYWPRGVTLAVNRDMEMVYQVAPGGRIDRIPAEQAQRVMRTFGRR